MNMTLLYRLAWKEVRSLRAFWLTLLGSAIALQILASWSVGNFWASPQINFLVPIWMPVMFSLACASVAFAGEREDGTDQFLNRLAAPPLSILIIKLGVNLFGTILLMAVLLPLAWPMGWFSLGSKSFTLSLEWDRMWRLALMWQIGFLAWGMFLSLLSRRVLTCVVLTTIATVLTPLVVAAILDRLPFRAARFEAFELSVRMVLIPSFLLGVSAWLVQTWDENRWPRLIELLLGGWHRLMSTRHRGALLTSGVLIEGRTKSYNHCWQASSGTRSFVRPFGLCLPDEWLPAWRREARRLLWLEFRQARRVMLFVVVAFGLYLVGQAVLVTSGFKLLIDESPFVLALMAFAFGVWSFQAQQLGVQFREYARHGVSPMAMWMCKQAVWLIAMFVTASALTVMTIWLCTADTGGQSAWMWRGTFLETLLAKLAYGVQWYKTSQAIDPQWLWESRSSLCVNAVLSLGLCFAVGQFVSLLIPRAVTTALVGFVLAGLAFGWQQLMAHLAVPSGVAVLPLIVGLLLASFVRMSDWLEERNSLRGWLKVAASLVLPSLITWIGVPLYRVYEVPAVEANQQQWLDEATKAPSIAAKQTAQTWIQTAELIDDKPVFRWIKRTEQTKPDGTKEEIEVEDEYSPTYFFDLRTALVRWANLKNRDWMTRHAGVLAEARQIAQRPDCSFNRELFEGNERRTRISHSVEQLHRLAVLLAMAAEQQMSEGQLQESLHHSLTLYRLSQHMQQHAGWNAVFTARRLELIAWSLLHDWSRHPNQTGDSLRAALGRRASDGEHPLHQILFADLAHYLPIGDAVRADYANAKAKLKQRWEEEPWLASWLVWERRREERLLDYLSIAVVHELEKYVSGGIPTGWGDSRFIRDIPHWKEGDHADFLLATTRPLDFAWERRDLSYQWLNERGEIELRRRALIVTLAMRAFFFDHGHLTEHWEELVGPYVDRIPVDPWTGQLFEYRPQGFPFDVWLEGRWIRANTPLFLSGGAWQQRFVPIAQPSKEEDALPNVKWRLVSKSGGVTDWPLDRDDYDLISMVAFPLAAPGP